MRFIQLYSVALAFILDFVYLFRLVVLRKTLSEASLFWFDKSADSAQGSVLFAVFLVYLAVPKLLVVHEPLNRWALLTASLGETLRVGVLSAAFADYEAASQLNTIALTLLGGNALVYWLNWYNTMKLFSRH